MFRLINNVDYNTSVSAVSLAFHRNPIDGSRLRWLLLLTQLLLVPMVQAEPLSPADLKALLGRIREKRAAAPQVQADFQEEKSVHLLNKPIISTGKMWFQAPNKFRREAKGKATPRKGTGPHCAKFVRFFWRNRLI